MFDREESFQFLRKYAYINLVVAGLLLLLGFFMKSGNENNGSMYLCWENILSVCFVLEFLLIRFFQYKSWCETILHIIWEVSLFVLAYAIFQKNADLYQIILAVALYEILSIQMMYVFDLSYLSGKITIAVLMILPMCIFVFKKALHQKNIDGMVIFPMIGIFFTEILNHIFRFVEFSDKMLKRVYQLNGIADVKQVEYETMESQSQKLIQINEQLSLERFKLKKANDTIMQNNEEIRIQNEVVKAAVKAIDIDKLFDYLVEATFHNLGADFLMFSVYTEGDEDGVLSLSQCSERSGITKVNTDLMEEIDFLREHYSEEESVEIYEKANETIRELFGTQIQTLFMLSVDLGEQNQGLYVLGNIEPNSYLDKRDFVYALFDHISLAIRNALLYSRMHDMATKDGLTGIYNRRYFNSIYKEIQEDCLEAQEPMTVILFDIDKFKNINDTYGHIFGDEVIRYCGQTALKYGKLHNGLPIRYGGEEFVLVFRNKNTEEVYPIIEELHTEIRNHEFHLEEQSIYVNTSVGIACYPDNCEDTENLLNAADTAMYSSKTNGRGRITIYSNE